MISWSQDKNRDVIVAFPDIDPSFIPTPKLSMPGGYHRYGKSVSRRTVLKEITNSFEQPHLWYSTSEVKDALGLFIASGDQLSGSNTYRLASVDFRTANMYQQLIFFVVLSFYTLIYAFFSISLSFFFSIFFIYALFIVYSGMTLLT